MRSRLTSVLVFLLSIAPFALCLRYGVVAIDDPLYYALPHQVVDGLTFKGLEWAFTDLSNAIWMPLVWLVYQFNHTLAHLLRNVSEVFDDFQTAYSIAHFEMVALHGVNALLLLALLRRLDEGKRLLVPALAALVWSVHPLRVESVVWIASMKDVVSMTFLLLAVISWVDFRTGARKARSYALSMTFFALGCCAKPSVMTFPGMVLLLDVLMLRRLSLEDFCLERLWPYVLPSILALSTAALSQRAQIVGHATTFQAGIPILYRLLNALTSLGVYVRNTILPVDLAPQCMIQYPKPPHHLAEGALLGLAVLVLAFRCGLTAFRKMRAGERPMSPTATAVLWYVGTIFPMLGISAFGGHAFADRFTYIPAVALSIALLGLKGLRTKTGCAVLACGACLLGGLSVRQVGFWKNDETLTRRILKVDGEDNFLARVNLAHYLFENKHTEDSLAEAVGHYSAAYRLNPRYCQRTGLIYLAMLGETGRTKEMPSVRLDFLSWLHARNVWRSYDQDIADGLCALYSEEASEGARASAMKEAKRIARELKSLGNVDVAQMYYLIYLTGEKSGDQELKRYGLDGIARQSKPSTGLDNTIRFRFLLGACED